MAYSKNNYIITTPVNNIPIRLIQGYPKFSFAREETTATEKYLIHSTDLAGFVTESLPPPIQFRGRVVVPNPRSLPGAPILYTKRVTAEPHTGEKPADPFNVYGNAPSGTFDEDMVVTVEYSTSILEDSTETVFEHSVNVGGEFFTLPPQKITIADGDVTVDEGQRTYEPNRDLKLPLSKVIPTIEHSFRFRFVTDPNWTLYQKLIGCVNKNHPLGDDGGSEAPLSGIPSAERETVMFMGLSGTQRVVWNDSSLVTRPWDLDFKFSHKHHTKENPADPDNPFRYGWNHFYIPNKGDWLRVLTSDDQPVHRPEDLNQIFNGPSEDDGDADD